MGVSLLKRVSCKFDLLFVVRQSEGAGYSKRAAALTFTWFFATLERL